MSAQNRGIALLQRRLTGPPTMPQSLPSPDTGAVLISLAIALSAFLAVLSWWSRVSIAGTTGTPSADAPSGTGSRAAWLDRVGELVLTRHPRQRQRCLHFLIGVVASLTGLAALQFGVQLGIVEGSEANWLTALALLTCVGLYARLRSAQGQSMDDSQSASWQLHAFLVFLAWGYVIGSEGRPVALLLLMMMLSFNVFLADGKLMRQLSLSSGGLFGLAMLRVAMNETSTQLGPALQLVYFVVMMLMLLCLTVMVQQLDTLRRKAHERKQALEQALSRIGEMATRDELTGLFNRRHMLEWLHTEKQRCQRQGRSFCLGLIDLDHFKNINDRHGHAVGDEALTQAAHTLASGLRETDLLARWGGEEFLVVFTDTDCATAQTVLDRIRHDLARTMVSASVPDLSLSFSAGLTTFKPDEMLTRAMDRADRALYLAKAAGRARTLVVEDIKPAQTPPCSPRGPCAGTC
jgi:diguanylate cyclase (GGDEF)-like protein